MTITRDYKETIRDRVQGDPAFKQALLKEAIECLLSGDVNTGKAVLKDFIKATSGFESLSRTVDKKPESLIRMLGPKGNPTATNLFQIIAQIQKQEGLHMEVNLAE
ncbi:MAG: DNA-binding protein [Thermodesulfobacteriota bacterium]|jgi:DNA-binding phage protein